MLCAVKPIAVTIVKLESESLVKKGLNKRALEDSGDGPMTKYRQVLDDAVNLKSTNREYIKRLTMQSQLMNKLKKDCATFILNGKLNVMVYILNI